MEKKIEISLIRHGKSKCIENNPITCREFRNWVNKYDYSGVFSEENFPLDTLIKFNEANVVITSDLVRAVESAKLLNSTRRTVSNAVFREIELPSPNKNIFGVKLTPKLWAFIFRCLWFCDFSSDCESLQTARHRAKKAAAILVEYASQHQSVALVGHGFFNMLVAKELLKIGWSGYRRTSRKHWSCTTYSK